MLRRRRGHVQHMQKALERMNIKLHDVISSLTGASGLAVVRAILGGERDPAALLELCDVRIRKAKAERVLESLRGNWADEHLFALGQAVGSWEHYQAQIVDCDRRIAQVLAGMPVGEGPAARAAQPAKRRTQPGVNTPQIDNLQDLLQRMCDGKDATSLPAHSEYTVLQLVGEVGTDLTKWPTVKHFFSWSCRRRRAERKLRAAVKRRRNRAGQLFCVIARALARSKYIALVAYYRRMAARRGGLVVNMALRISSSSSSGASCQELDFVQKGARLFSCPGPRNRQRLSEARQSVGQQLVPVRPIPPEHDH